MAALNIQHADAFALKHQGNCEFRAHAIDRIDVARVLRSIANPDGVAGRSGGPRDSLPQGDSQILRQLAGIADGEAVPEIAAIPFKHQHAKYFIVDMPLDQSRRSRQDLVEIERGIDFFADFRQRRQDFGGDLRSAIQCGCRRLFIRWIHEVSLL